MMGRRFGGGSRGNGGPCWLTLLSSGSVEMLTQGMNIDAPDETWLWEGVLMHADSNMIVSVPKVGKTSCWSQ